MAANIGWWYRRNRQNQWFWFRNVSSAWFHWRDVGPASTGLSATVNQASETDTAQPMSWAPKRRLVTQASESELAQAITSARTAALSHTTEVDTAPPITPQKVRAIGPAAETDLAQSLSHRKTKILGQTLETDLATSISAAVLSGTIIGVSERDLRNGGNTIVVTLVGRTWRPAGVPFDEDRAFIRSSFVGDLEGLTDWDTVTSNIPVANVVRTSDRVVTITLPALNYDIPTVETITATFAASLTNENSGEVIAANSLLIRLSLDVAVSQVVETDLAQPVTQAKSRALGQTSEADIAQPIMARKMRTIGQSAETDLAQSLSHRKTKILGQTLELDLTQPISVPGQLVVPVNQVVEPDTAQPMSWAPKHRLVNQASESDSAHPLTHAKILALGIPVETDLAQALATWKRWTLGHVVELDLAQLILWAPKRRLVGQVFEADFSQPITVAVGEKLRNILEGDSFFATAYRADSCVAVAQLDTGLFTVTSEQPVDF